MRMVSSRSGLVDNRVTGQPTSSSNSTNVFYRLCGQLRPGTCTRCGLFPSLNSFIDRLDPGLRLFAGRQVVDLAPVQTITDANLDLVEPIENVQFCQGQAINTACPHGLPDKHSIEPAAAARPSRHRTELRATLAQRFPDRIVHLIGRETAPNPRGWCRPCIYRAHNRSHSGRDLNRSPPVRPPCSTT